MGATALSSQAAHTDTAADTAHKKHVSKPGNSSLSRSQSGASSQLPSNSGAHHEAKSQARKEDRELESAATIAANEAKAQPPVSDQLELEVTRCVDEAAVLRCRVPCMHELPKLQEERSLECTFQVTFLVPCGEDGKSLLDSLSAAFEGAACNEDVVESTRGKRSFVLVPYTDSRTALVQLEQLGPCEALEYTRNRARQRFQEHKAFGADSPTADKAVCLLPEPKTRPAAESTALVYLVCATECADRAEAQLGPICSVEAFYATMRPELRPCRFVAALHEPESVQPGPINFDAPGPLGEWFLKELHSRRASTMPCAAVARGDVEGMRSLVATVVHSLAADFCPSARVRSKGDAPETASTVTPSTGLSRTSCSPSATSSANCSAVTNAVE